jgi:hypothetical protein
MSGPFSLGNAALNSEALSNSDSESGEDDQELLSQESLVKDDGTLSRKNDLSTGWMFSGRYILDLERSDEEFSVELVERIFLDARKSPVKLDHMIVFVNRQVTKKKRSYEIQLRGYLQGAKTSMFVLEKWFGKGFQWTPLRDIGASVEYNNDLELSEDKSSDWNVLGHCGRRNKFIIQCRAFIFEACVQIDIDSLVEDNDHTLRAVKRQVLAKIDTDQLKVKGATFVFLQCDGQTLADACANTSVTIKIQGFIRCKRTGGTELQDCIALANWIPVRGNFWTHPQYVEAISESSPWVTIFESGVLKQAGRPAASKASSIQLHPPHYSFVRYQCRRRRCPDSAIRCVVHLHF